jgi:hypothetical protein
VDSTANILYKDFRVLSAFDGSAGGSLMYILLTDSCKGRGLKNVRLSFSN